MASPGSVSNFSSGTDWRGESAPGAVPGLLLASWLSPALPNSGSTDNVKSGFTARRDHLRDNHLVPLRISADYRERFTAAQPGKQA